MLVGLQLSFKVFDFFLREGVASTSQLINKIETWSFVCNDLCFM